MAKILDFKKSVYELVKEYPEIIDIMSESGLSEIRKKAVLNSVGKLMTIPKGTKFKKIDLGSIVDRFKAEGFEVINVPNDGSHNEDNSHSTEDSNNRLELLKSYLTRLNNGESLEDVRADFVNAFRSVDASEIMSAEQELLHEGAPLKQVQKLCDVHSALFHDKIKEAKEQERSTIAMAKENATKATALIAVDGHPLQTMTRENEALKSLIDTARKQLGNNIDCSETLEKIREAAVHYAKKGDLLYPMLNARYGIIGPSQVMWTLDGEIRSELSSLIKATDHDDEWKGRVRAVLQRMNEMIYKEDNILFPVCAANFSEEEWKQIYRDSRDYAVCLDVKPLTWEDAERTNKEDNKKVGNDGIINLPTGSFTIEQLTALLNTLPFEITFVDADNINRYFNEGHKEFKRPLTALRREVFTCHPPKVEPMVRAIIDDFRNGRRDLVPVWLMKNGRATLVKYMAVRDSSGNYLGTMEIVQDMEEARRHFEKNK